MNYSSRISKLVRENLHSEADKMATVFLKLAIANFLDLLTVLALVYGLLFLFTAIWSYL